MRRVTALLSLLLCLAVVGHDGVRVEGAGASAGTRVEQETRVPRVAAASSLNFALKAIAERYTREQGRRVDVVFGASGTLARQIQDGAPFDLFLAADEEFPARLAAAGLTRDAGVVYATGRLVVFTPNGSPLTPDAQLADLGRLLSAGGVARFAIANPEVAPYGKAAEAVLRKRGLWDRLKPSLVLGDTIAQAAQFATTGNAVGGLMAYSLVKSPELAERGRFALIPAGDHPALRQRMVMMKSAVADSDAFYRYLQGDAARAVFQQYGFETP